MVHQLPDGVGFHHGVGVGEDHDFSADRGDCIIQDGRFATTLGKLQQVNATQRERLSERFDALHEALRCQAGKQAALAVSELLESDGSAP